MRAGHQSVPLVMADLRQALRRRGVKGAIFESCILMPRMTAPVTNQVIYEGPSWKLTLMGERFDEAGYA